MLFRLPYTCITGLKFLNSLYNLAIVRTMNAPELSMDNCSPGTVTCFVCMYIVISLLPPGMLCCCASGGMSLHKYQNLSFAVLSHRIKLIASPQRIFVT